MRQLLKDGHVVDDNWILVDDGIESLPLQSMCYCPLANGNSSLVS